MSHVIINNIILASWETIYMVFLSSLISIVTGLVIGLFLNVANNHSNIYIKTLHVLMNITINISRSIPYIILMILLIPFTKLLINTSIGTNAAIIPLTIAAIPFYARIAESAISKVDTGLIEAAKSMGSNLNSIMFKVLIPEAKEQLISGAALTIISLIGYSAMAGAVGGGGLGALAIQYGYNRFNIGIMIITVIILIILVQIIQFISDYIIKKKTMLILWILLIPMSIGSIFYIIHSNFNTNNKLIKIGVMSGPMTDIMNEVSSEAMKKYRIQMKVISFDNYELPNEALDSGSINANIFQHRPFLNAEIRNRNYKIAVLGNTYIYPMGFYSSKLTNISQIKYNSIIAIPNDPTNEGRALLLLEKSGLIKLSSKNKWNVTPNDILDNPYNLRFKELDSAQIPRLLNQVAIGAITDDFLDLTRPKLTLKNALLSEDKSSKFVNVMVVKSNDIKNKKLIEILNLLRSKKIIELMHKYYPNGAAIPGW